MKKCDQKMMKTDESSGEDVKTDTQTRWGYGDRKAQWQPTAGNGDKET